MVKATQARTSQKLWLDFKAESSQRSLAKSSRVKPPKSSQWMPRPGQYSNVSNNLIFTVENIRIFPFFLRINFWALKKLIYLWEVNFKYFYNWFISCNNHWIFCSHSKSNVPWIGGHCISFKCNLFISANKRRLKGVPVMINGVFMVFEGKYLKNNTLWNLIVWLSR